MASASSDHVPEPVAYLRDLLAGFAPPWVLCGGWAADGWLGRQTRDLGDVDIAVFHHDQYAVFEQFPGWALVGHDPNVPDETTEQWNGRPLDMPAHIHLPKLGSPLATSATLRHPDFESEFLLNEATAQHWILNRELGITRPLADAIGTSRWGVPTAAPEIVMFFKAGGERTVAEIRQGKTFRARDEQDFHALLPILTAAQLAWLRESFARMGAEHPWSGAVAAAGGSGSQKG